jgi:two-component system CheB/CheR fusion protein
VFREREIQTKEGAWRLMRVMPYRTHENLIDGLVITFVDIDRIKRAEQESQEARSFAEGIVESVSDALLVLDPSLHVLSANRSFYELFRTTPKLVLGEPLLNLGDGNWDSPKLMNTLKQLIDSGDGTAELSLELEFPRAGRKALEVTARRIQVDREKPAPILLSLAEVTASDGARSIEAERD